MQPLSDDGERQRRQGEADQPIAGSGEGRLSFLQSQVSRALQRGAGLAVQAARWLNDYNAVITAVATVVIAYLTYSLAVDSARQAEISQGALEAVKGQLDAMRADQRPWVAISSSPELLELKAINDFWVDAVVQIQIKNSGKTPARRVILKGTLVPIAESMKIYRIQREFCKPVNYNAEIPPGSEVVDMSLFPDVSITYSGQSF